MECGFLERRFADYSDEKKKYIAVMLGNKYYCPYHREIHHLEAETHGETQKH